MKDFRGKERKKNIEKDKKRDRQAKGETGRQTNASQEYTTRKTNMKGKLTLGFKGRREKTHTIFRNNPFLIGQSGQCPCGQGPMNAGHFLQSCRIYSVKCN